MSMQKIAYEKALDAVRPECDSRDVETAVRVGVATIDKERLRRIVTTEKDGFSSAAQSYLRILGFDGISWARIIGAELHVFAGYVRPGFGRSETEEYMRRHADALVQAFGGEIRILERDPYYLWVFSAIS